MYRFEPKGIIRRFGRDYMEYNAPTVKKMLPICENENGEKYYILPQLEYQYNVNDYTFNCNYCNNIRDAICFIQAGKADTILSKENKITGRIDAYVAKFLDTEIGDKYRKEFLVEAMDIEFKGYILTLQLKTSIYEDYPGIFTEPIADRYLSWGDYIVENKENAIIYNSFEKADAYKNAICREAKFLQYVEKEEPKTIYGELKRLEYIVQTSCSSRDIYKYLSPYVSFIPTQYCVLKENKETEKEN